VGRVTLKDSGERTEFSTGSQRDRREGKGRFDLLILGWPRILFRLARHMEEGTRKYGKGAPPYCDNWTLGQPLSTYLDSGLRHLTKWASGEDDEEHFTAMLWNLLCLGETYIRIEEGLLPEELNDLGDRKVGYDSWER
jgi:hypothetical protein